MRYLSSLNILRIVSTQYKGYWGLTSLAVLSLALGLNTHTVQNPLELSQPIARMERRWKET